MFFFQKCVTALNATWHPEHFFCAQCGRPFGDDGFHEKDGKAFCRADYFEMFAPKCGGCARAIVDNYISALNRHWHPECFACWVSLELILGRARKICIQEGLLSVSCKLMCTILVNHLGD